MSAKASHHVTRKISALLRRALDLAPPPAKSMQKDPTLANCVAPNREEEKERGRRLEKEHRACCVVGTPQRDVVTWEPPPAFAPRGIESHKRKARGGPSLERARLCASGRHSGVSHRRLHTVFLQEQNQGSCDTPTLCASHLSCSTHSRRLANQPSH